MFTCLLSDDITQNLSQLQLKLKLLKGAIDRRNSRLEERRGLKYFYRKATYPRRSSETERRETEVRERGWSEGGVRKTD